VAERPAPSAAAPQPDFELEAVVPLDAMPSSGEGQCYVVLRPQEGALAVGKVLNILKFTVKEIDPSSGEAEESG
jgi:coatomer subunit gamma